MTLFPAVSSASSPRWAVLMVLMLVIWVILAARLWQLQVLRAPHYQEVAERNYLRSLDIPAPRGKIYDRHGALILGNRPFYDLMILPQFISDLSATFRSLARLLKMDEDQLWQNYQPYKKAPEFLAVPVKKNLTLHEVALVQSARMFLPGVDIATDVRRDYSSSPPPHLVGYLAAPTAQEYSHYRNAYPQKDYRRNDLVGKYGLEQVWESHLRGKRGRKWIRVDALGRRVLSESLPYQQSAAALPEQPAAAGHHLVLTLDAELQKIAEDAFAGKNGAVVVLDARSGGILALVSTPDYPADLYQSQIPAHRWRNLLNDPMHPLFDKTTGAEFQPGSTFKVIVALAGLQEALITPKDEVLCTGAHTFGGRTFHCHKKEGHGRVDLKRALSESCNVYFYQLAHQLKIDRIARYGKMFHLGRKLGLNLNLERSGLIATPQWKKRSRGQPWFLGETFMVGIGQGATLITPLQLASLYGSLGNWGQLWQPYLVRRVVDRLGKTVESYAPRLITSLDHIEKRHFREVRQGLHLTVHGEQGTARRARVPGVSVAGKTGSVQVVAMHRGLNKEGLFDAQELALGRREHALFAAYSPAEDAQIALAVVSQHDSYGGGGARAAPVAQKIISGYWRLKHERALRQAQLTQPVGTGRELGP